MMTGTAGLVPGLRMAANRIARVVARSVSGGLEPGWNGVAQYYAENQEECLESMEPLRQRAPAAAVAPSGGVLETQCVAVPSLVPKQSHTMMLPTSSFKVIRK